METKSVLEQTNLVSQMMRERWDALGFVEAEDGGFATGHMPSEAPTAYLCRCYAGLSEEGLVCAEEESGRYLPEPYKDLLRVFNGAQIMGISLLGATMGINPRSLEDPIGQPISISYQNLYYLRPEYIPEGHFGFGTMNGDWYSQGQLYLNSTGEVELYHRDFDLVGASWPSLSRFLEDEVSRQMTRYRDDGTEIAEVSPLPGDTKDWERLAKQAEDSRSPDIGILDRLKNVFFRQ
ncbi:SMI1/KNR4 family protein [Ruegeria sp. SCPT10]|uniref:SMI1/KNR4 family protein n=1 Tax=Ruegeria sp. SCP10 TaxID=3141377 RepID=UPI0033353152